MNHAQILDDLIREIDALQSCPMRAIARNIQIQSALARSTVKAWIDQFVSLLVQP